MSKKNKAPKKEYIPDGMKREDYADAAFRKKVTIIMGSLLLVFIVAVVGVLVGAWAKTEKHNKEFEAKEQAFLAEKETALTALKKIDSEGGTFEDKAQVKITLNDDNFSDWITALDDSYQLKAEDEGYAAFKGATIELEGVFHIKELKGGNVFYWVYRLHSHDGEDSDHEHNVEGEVATNEMIPIEVIFLDENAELPKEGDWVKVTGVVGPDSTHNLSAVRNAVVTVMDEHGEAHVE